MEIKFNAKQKFSPAAKQILKDVTVSVFGDEPIKMVPSEPGPDVLCFGTTGGIDTLSPWQVETYSNPHPYLRIAFSKLKVETRIPWDCDPEKVLYLDTETHNAGKQWGMTPREFFRLGQYAWGPLGEVHLTTDYDEILEVVRSAHGVVAHNGHPFDLSTLFGKDSTEALEMAMENRIFDTMVFANLALPAPEVYTTRAGVKAFGGKPEMIRKWLSLDNLCYQLGLDGKEGDLKALAKKYNPPKTRVADMDYGLIPLDDPEFLDYARQDVKALQELTTALIIAHPITEYDWREQLNAAIDAQNSRNGFKVDIEVAQARADMLAARRQAILDELVEKYDFPTEGKMPWRKTEGIAAIRKALYDVGIVPEAIVDWTKTKTGNVSLGGDVLIEQTKGTDAEELGQALAELMGQRTLSQLALDSVHPDGFTHPDITALQRSGRKSTTKPGLTVWSSRGDKSIEKSYFVPDTEEQVLIEFDFSQADARIVAAYSGDEGFKERFAEGVDAHELTGRVVFGDEVYDSNPYEYRQTSKALGHAYAYRAAPKTLARTSGQPESVARMFVEKMQRAYPDVTYWQEVVTDEGRRGFVINDWGRRMEVDPERAYTQAPAMYGQSGTRELVVDALIRLLYDDIRFIKWLKAQVHDALVFSIPEVDLFWAVPRIKELMESHWKPRVGGQEIHFPVGSGPAAKNWQLAGH